MAEKILDFTAEQINLRLSLIDENKNLLEYPYTDAVYPTSLTDVGDGSILTSGISASEKSLPLKTFSLQAGDYEVSLAVTTINDVAVNSHGFSLSITGNEVSTNGNTLTVTSDNTTVTVVLNIPDTFSPNWLIKPQIVKDGQDTSIWVPNMDKIGTYVDRRFNGTNAKLRDVRAFMDLIEIVDA